MVSHQPGALVLFLSLPAHDSFNLHISPQTELSLQKEQLQLKIIEIEDEAEKWQKEKDRIKVSGLRLPCSGALTRLYCLGEGRPQCCSRLWPTVIPILPCLGSSQPLCHSHTLPFSAQVRHFGRIFQRS